MTHRIINIYLYLRDFVFGYTHISVGHKRASIHLIIFTYSVGINPRSDGL